MKIGIISLYKNSKNYGGLLQSYALVKLLDNLNYTAEQISFLKNNTHFDCKMFVKMCIIKILGIKLSYKLKRLFKRKTDERQIKDEIIEAIYSRENKLKKFEKSIPHSHSVYTNKNIARANKKYDAFITGSDQVWNFSWFNPAYFLDFVDDSKIKIAYAASMPQIDITDEQKQYLRTALKNFNGISVREDITKTFFCDQLSLQAEHVLDPTLMLDRADWDCFSSERLIADKYVFCYFLTEGKEKREAAREFASTHGYKLTSLPYLIANHNDDEGFGDYQLFDCSPNDFASLIKYSEFVFCDSFHAAVFSNIFHKEFCVIDRSDKYKNLMTSRLTSLLKMFNENDRFLTCDECSLSNIEALQEIDFEMIEKILKHERKKSEQFLLSNLTKEK